jgi:hypothetical protein
MRRLKADPNTSFRIDWARLEKGNSSAIEVMQEHLCKICQEELADVPDPEEVVDGVDQATGEVHRVPLVHEHLVVCCSQQPDYITPTTPLTRALFLALLADWDNCLTPVQLQKRIGRSSPEAILRLLVSGPTRNMVVPVLSDNDSTV